MGIVFFKINKHKKYNYKPVFYDPDKEESQVNLHHKKESIEEIESLKQRIQMQWHSNKKKKPTRYPNMTIALILTLLSIVMYFLFK